MQHSEYVNLMATYNQRMNVNVFEACKQLSPEQLTADRKAFFRSIIGTLNHLVVADTIWLKRFSSVLRSHSELNVVDELAMPPALDTILHPDLEGLWIYRQYLDSLFLSLASLVHEQELLQTITYRNVKGDTFSRSFFGLLMHVFNHQTHHRGQVTTLLSQCDIDVGVTDLLPIIPTI